MSAAFRTLCLLAMLAAGCATTDTLAPARTMSATRVFPHPYERAYAAVLAAAKSEHLAVLESDRASGRVKLANRLTTSGHTEPIDVTVRPADGGSSAVTVQSPAPGANRDTPPNWGRIIDDRIGEFREAPAQRGQPADWGAILLARIAAELDALR